jgi:hypothetical protein
MTVTAAVLAAVALWAAWRIGAAYAALSASHALVALQTELDECIFGFVAGVVMVVGYLALTVAAMVGAGLVLAIPWIVAKLLFG